MMDGRATSWMDQAACAGMDTALFFPTRGDQTGVARAVCATCPVAQECLAYAVDQVIVHGIWGGATVRERRALRGARRGRPRQPIPHGTESGYCSPNYKCRCDACRDAHRVAQFLRRPAS